MYPLTADFLSFSSKTLNPYQIFEVEMAHNKYNKSALTLTSDTSIDMTPIDGRVATVSQDQKWFITTPNQTFIPEPPFRSNRAVIQRCDY
ncbi:hypothetical protein BDN72DRAFT_906578 [Pluteus cervinus]|uniref:Uncharacterized protein n=1 Tax=Pluteus cervinus TaxID=181527 RepID=A0ACD2ZYW5_9AGAR|nr:hypothetical protein BDN72DRAFT_906578 [Pluteus cervinus]